jgi:hypothetical protein
VSECFRKGGKEVRDLIKARGKACVPCAKLYGKEEVSQVKGKPCRLED